jgi:uncharacterized protein (TIGR02722 family)
MHRFRWLVAGIAGAAVIAGLSSCSTVPKVTRTDTSEQIDLSGEWNDTDSQMVSAEMVKDALARPWVDNFLLQNSSKPRVIVGTVTNRSHEHINTETFVKDLEREVTNTGRVIFVASKEQRDEVREERADQAENARADTVNKTGQEYGADFMLKGQVNTILDEAGKKAVRYYQVELEMIDMTSNEKVWIGQKKLKKLVERKRVIF